MPQHNADKISFACRSCGQPTEVKGSRPVGNGETIRRRRHCTGCDNRVTTFEVVSRKAPHIEVQLTNLDRLREKLAASLAMVDAMIEETMLIGDYVDLRYEPSSAVLEEIRRLDEA